MGARASRRSAVTKDGEIEEAADTVHVEDHRSELGRWRTVYRSADPRLRHYVHGYLGSTSHLPNPIRERHLPSTEVSLIVNFAAPHRLCAGDGQERWAEHDGVWVTGLRERHQLAESFGERHFMIVRFTPLGAHLFLRLPMDSIAGLSVPLDAFDPRLAGLILDRAAMATNWDDRFAAVEALIAERVLETAAPDAVTWVWNRLAAANGSVALGRLASEVECSQRHLIQQFRTSVGLSPKTVARLFRFNLAVRALNGFATNRSEKAAGKPYIEVAHQHAAWGTTVRWADIAAHAGYSDQPHFIKEFRQFAGATPAAFLRSTVDVG
jgi:AraC-like DNA-binding protein